MVFKISRFSDHEQQCPEEPKLTERAKLLFQWTNEFYDFHPNLVRNNIFFLQMGNKFIWKFNDCGFHDVFFPINRLPKGLESFIINKAKVKNDAD